MFDSLPWPRGGPQSGGPIQRPNRRSSLWSGRSSNQPPIPPPMLKRARIEAGRAKLMAKAARSAERSRRAREAS